MRAMTIIWAWFLMLVMANVAVASESPDMKLVLNKNGIKVWAYRVSNSPLYGFKAVTTVKSSLAGVVALVADTDAAPRWLYRTSEVEALKRDDQNMTFTVRVVTDFPWPFKDREAVVAGKISQDPNNLSVRVDSNSVGSYPLHEGYLRMPEVQGSWIFKPIGQGQVEITMTGHADPGGYLPASLINLLIQEHPYNSLLGLREIIGESRFQTVRVANIREPIYN